MRNLNDLLTPKRSPETLQLTGVLRVNHLPLALVLGVVTLFILLIAYVATTRAAPKHSQENENPLRTSMDANTLTQAYEIIGKHKTGLVPSEKKTVQMTETIELPVAVIDNPNTPPKPYVREEIPDTELERIRQEKTQQFEAAVKASSAVAINHSALNPYKTNQSNEINQKDMQLLANAGYSVGGQSGHLRQVEKSFGGHEDEARWNLHSQLKAPDTPFVLRTGSVIPGVMVSHIRSELKGQIIGQVRQNVYDTATGRHLLIPQGTKLLGLYSSDVNFGQDTLLVAWQRLTFPDGRTFDIGSMPGADGAGVTGFRGSVDNHYGRIYGSALLMSGIVAGITYSQSQNQANQGVYYQPTAGSVLSQALGQQLGEATSQLMMKNINVAPTLQISSGYRFNIITVKDLVFEKPYLAFDY